MPMYDFQCPKGHTFESLQPVGTQETRCRVCAEANEWEYAVKVWISKPANVIGDECDIIQENGFATPQRFRSKAERKRALREVGCEEAVRHIGVPGSDKSPHTQSWASVSPATLENARLLLERVGGIRGQDPAEDDLQQAVEVGEVQVPIAGADGRTIGLSIGKMYGGVLDESILKR